MSEANMNPEKNYQENCKPVDEALREIQEVFAHPDWKFERFDVFGITTQGNKIRLTWDRKDIRKTEEVKP